MRAAASFLDHAVEPRIDLAEIALHVAHQIDGLALCSRRPSFET